MIKFFQRAEAFCGLLSVLTFIAYVVYNFDSEGVAFLTYIEAGFLAAIIGGIPYFIFKFIFRTLVNLDMVKPDGMETGEELFGFEVKRDELEAPEEEPLLSSPSYEELYLETERRKKLDDETDPAPDLIELYRKLEDKRNQK